MPQAKLREAYSNLAQFNGPNFDATSVVNAKTLLTQIKSEYPDLARKENVDQNLELADHQLARRLYLNADFYRRTHKPAAAATLCRRIIETYPNSSEARDAQALLERVEPGTALEPTNAAEKPTP